MHSLPVYLRELLIMIMSSLIHHHTLLSADSVNFCCRTLIRRGKFPDFIFTQQDPNLIPARIDWDAFKTEVAWRESRRHRIGVELATLGFIPPLTETPELPSVGEWLVEPDEEDAGSSVQLSSVQFRLGDATQLKGNVREEVIFAGKLAFLVRLTQVQFLRPVSIRPMIHLTLDLPPDPKVLAQEFEYELDRALSKLVPRLELQTASLNPGKRRQSLAMQTTIEPHNLVLAVKTGVTKKQFPPHLE